MDSDSNVNEYLRKLEKLAENTFWTFIGCELDEFLDNRVVVRVRIQPHHLNLIGILHGGVHAMLIDSAMGLVAMAAKPKESVVTSTLNLNYVAPIETGSLIVTAEILHISRKMVTAQAFARNDAGELCAFGTGTFRIIEKKTGD
jgi:uncharacterized protein (TIGR00369 family)